MALLLALRPVVVVTSLFATSIGLARLHLHLTKSFPAEDATISVSPDSIRLWFNEPVEHAVSAIWLEGSAGEVDVGKVEETEEPSSIVVHVGSLLPAGRYRVNWRAAGRDGHPVRGTFSFVITRDTSRAAR